MATIWYWNLPLRYTRTMMINISASRPPANVASGRRFAFGVLLFVCGRLTFLLIPFIRGTSLDTEWKNVLSVLCLFGLPDLFTIMAAAVLGKEGFSRLKKLLFGSLKRFSPPAKVGRRRYRFGLGMFFVPIVFGWGYPYLIELAPEFQRYQLIISVIGDLIFIASFFVLGGEFWNKLRDLFIHDHVAGGKYYAQKAQLWHVEEAGNNALQKTSGTDSPADFGRHLKLGAAMLGLSIALPLLGITIVTFLNLGKAQTAALSAGALMAGELLGILAIAVMGKPGYIFLKVKIAALFKRHGPSQTVSRGRYRFGLVLFFIPLLFGWISVYIHAVIPGFQLELLPYALAGDLLFIASFFVLGGDFWDRLQSLFRHEEVPGCKNPQDLPPA